MEQPPIETTSKPERPEFTIKGVFDPPTGGSPFGDVTISQDAWDKQNPTPQKVSPLPCRP